MRSADGRCCWRGAAFALASAVVFLVADDVPLLLVGRLLSGLSAGIFTGTATAAVVEAAPPAQRDRAAVAATIANVGGLGAGPAVGRGAGRSTRRTRCSCRSSCTSCWSCWRSARCCWRPRRRRGPDASDFSDCRYPPRCARCSSPAATAAFAGFAVMGLFTAVAPSFVAGVIGIDNHAVAGAVAGSIFAALGRRAVARPADSAATRRRRRLRNPGRRHGCYLPPPFTFRRCRG